MINSVANIIVEYDLIRERDNQIHLEYLEGRIQMSEYRKSPYKSIGNVIHWLYVYGYQWYDTAIIGERKVWTGPSQQELLATFIWSDDLQMPIFDFFPPRDFIWREQAFYINAIVKHKTSENMFINTMKGKMNLNQKIFVKLTVYGEDKYYRYFHKERFPIAKKEVPNVVGFYSFTLWEFMAIFGESMYNGAPEIIERNQFYWE